MRAKRRLEAREAFLNGASMADLARRYGVNPASVRPWVDDLRARRARGGYTNHQRREFKEMHAQGYKIRVIAEKLGVAIKTAYQWSHALYANGTTRREKAPSAPR